MLLFLANDSERGKYMKTSKILIVGSVICAVLGVSGVAYAVQPVKTDVPDTVRTESVSVVENALESEITSREGGEVLTEEESVPETEENVPDPYVNIMSEGDFVLNENEFLHTFSNGEQACIKFRHGAALDVESLKKLGSDTPFKDEICYSVIEFLDGTKRYFRMGEDPDEIMGVNTLEYGIHLYVEGGSGEYYSETLSDGMTISGWR